MQVYIGAFNRDMSTASGSEVIAGVGFKPKVVIFIAANSTAVGQVTWGFDDSVNGWTLRDDHNILVNTWSRFLNRSMDIVEDAVKYYQGSISAFSNDGFTIDWVRGGAMTGSASVGFLALG